MGADEAFRQDDVPAAGVRTPFGCPDTCKAEVRGYPAPCIGNPVAPAGCGSMAACVCIDCGRTDYHNTLARFSERSPWRCLEGVGCRAPAPSALEGETPTSQALRSLVSEYGLAIRYRDFDASAKLYARIDKAVTALTAEVARLGDDAARLDWMEANPGRWIPARSPMPGSVRTVRPEGLYTADSVREALDAARSPQQSEGEE
jgi:hypothetical protein